MNGLLVRVGIDSTDGAWNAPVLRESGQFAYVTITESKEQRSGLARYYDEFSPAVTRFGTRLPAPLIGQPTHLDPDFDWLTYGDQGQRGRRIASLGGGDLLAFFASLRPVNDENTSLVYALIGLYVIEDLVPACTVPMARWAENAHTRRESGPDDIIVRARCGVSGRLKRCLPIGEYRDRAYRVRHDLLADWGDLDIKNGYIQRSARLPAFRDAPKFYQWFLKQNPELVAENNPKT